jgi:predicted HTH domain antitoxin
MKSIIINVPDMSDLDSKELSMMVASQLYESGKLSLGQAAEVAGFSKRSFAEYLANYKVSIFNSPVNSLSNDVANA